MIAGVSAQGAATGPPPPSLVVGMHGSGTSILAEILDRGGLFLGVDAEHCENSFFREDVAQAIVLGREDRWATLPLPSVEEVMAHEPAARARIERDWLARYRALGYDGSGPWGFKDPRSCLLLPLYLAIFPGARVLHIVRDPEDVAASLARQPKRGVGRLRDFVHWRQLAVEYAARVRWCTDRHPNPHLEIRYEDLCREPARAAQIAFDFVGIPMTPAVRSFALERVHSRSVGRARGGFGPRLARLLSLFAGRR
jgi:hypothetical protein